MNADCLKLTAYFGESERVGGGLVSDALLACLQRHGIELAALLRGSEGFGMRHRLHSDRLPDTAPALPIVLAAVDRRDRIEAALPEADELVAGGLVTLERARLLTGEIAAVELPQELHEATKLTVYLGRGQHRAVLELLRAYGLAGATVLLGVDGMTNGVRSRARFFSRNLEVPLMVISVGAGATIARVLPQLGAVRGRPALTLERVRVCKRDGAVLAEPHALPREDESGLGLWQKLMIYAGAGARSHGHPLASELLRRLRAADAAGATVLRGFWSYAGDEEPHGDRLLSLRRQTPTVSVVVDRPDAIRRLWPLVDELTAEAGLVTSELVPAFRAGSAGGLQLASHRF